MKIVAFPAKWCRVGFNSTNRPDKGLKMLAVDDIQKMDDMGVTVPARKALDTIFSNIVALTMVSPMTFVNFKNEGVNVEWDIAGGRVVACVEGDGSVEYMSFLIGVDSAGRRKIYRTYLSHREFISLISTVDAASGK